MSDIHRRLEVIELAALLGNVAEACRRTGVDRSHFYDWKQRYEAQGLDGLANMPPVPRYSPLATADATVDEVLALALANPAWGCGRLAGHLRALDPDAPSSPTIQKILIRHGLGSRADRLTRLEEEHLLDARPLDEAFLAQLLRHNPCLAERAHPAAHPGALLVQEAWPIGAVPGAGRMHLHVVVDAFCSHAFTMLYAGNVAEAAVALLHNEVVPFYRARGLAIEAISAQTRAHFPRHPFGFYLMLNGIRHEAGGGRIKARHGFMRRFAEEATTGFLHVGAGPGRFGSAAALGEAWAAWLAEHNTTRPHRGYRNFGTPPAAVLADYVAAAVGGAPAARSARP